MGATRLAARRDSDFNYLLFSECIRRNLLHYQDFRKPNIDLLSGHLIYLLEFRSLDFPP